jgi:drug/metabolite transporter (DMT)-like permease
MADERGLQVAIWLMRVFNSRSETAYVLLAASALFWAGNFVVGRGMHALIPPLGMAWMRWTIASAILLPFAVPRLRRDWPLIRANWLILLALGTIGVGGFNTFAYVGLNHTSALNGLIIQSAGPVLIMLTALALFGERISRHQLAGVVTSLLGVVVIVTKAEPMALARLEFNVGDLWILGAMQVWATYTVLLRKRPDIHPLSFLAVTFIIGALVNTPLALYEHLCIRQFQATPGSLMTIAYIAVFPSILAYLFWNRGVALVGSSRAGVFLHLVPLFGSVLAMLFLAETPALHHGLGFAMILAGVSIATKRKES